MFGWFKRNPPRLKPERSWKATVENGVLSVADAAGETKILTTDDLAGVAIETNDSGPWGADVWWLFFGPDDQLVCTFPQGATGGDAVIDYICALPGFDQAAMVNAMASTDNATFAVWRKPA